MSNIHLKVSVGDQWATACGTEERRAQRLTINEHEVTCRKCKRSIIKINDEKRRARNNGQAIDVRLDPYGQAHLVPGPSGERWK